MEQPKLTIATLGGAWGGGGGGGGGGFHDNINFIHSD